MSLRLDFILVLNVIINGEKIRYNIELLPQH